MKCAVHAEVDATGFCRDCGKALCDACKRDVHGILYCEDCLARMVARPEPAPGAGNPTLAAVLGFIPGLGAVYNGEYMKALVHVLIFGSLIAIASEAHSAEALFGILTAAFYFYMPVEAYRTAKAKALGQPAPTLLAYRGEQPVGAFVLIVIGLLFLLHNLVPGFNPWRWIGELWPLILIIIGVMMLRRRMQRPETGESQK
jgi:hypothetical protein